MSWLALKVLSHEIFDNFFVLRTKLVLFVKPLIVFTFFFVDHLRGKINCKRLSQFLQIGLEFSPISLNPLAVDFNCFSKAEWELLTGFLKPHGS